MIKFYLYSNEHPDGKELARVSDENQFYLLASYYRNTYNDERFQVTVKRPRKKEGHIVGSGFKTIGA